MSVQHAIDLSAATLLARGQALELQDDLQGAGSMYEQALALDPRNADAHYLLGLLAMSAHDDAGALEQLRSAYELNPHHGPCAYLLGHLLQKTGQPAAALESLDRAGQLMPPLAVVLNCRAQVLYDLERFADAVQACDQALLLDSGSLATHFIRGGALTMMGRYAQALRSYDQLLAIDPRHAGCHSNRAQALIRLSREEGCDDALLPALHHLKQSLATQPHQPDVHRLCGCIHRRLGELDSALRSYHEAIRQDPLNHAAHYGLGVCWLTQGDWARGWEKFEYRCLVRPGFFESNPQIGMQPWKGEPLDGKSIMLYAEDGLGDTIQFFRYVQPVSELGASVSLVLPQALKGLLGAGYRAGATGQCCDYYCNMMSLPLVFGTLPHTVPAAHGYIQADGARTAHWRQRLGRPGRLRVGLAWSGNPEHLNDHNRSMRLAQLASLLDVPGVDYFCLQQVVRDKDRDTLAAMPQLAFFGLELKDFEDTAALCEAMDLVISVDTSVAHLAGALGKPVWIMLPAVAEYRWMVGREDTPWYASARLFRQPSRGDWVHVVARIRAQLQQLAAGRLSLGVPAGATAAAQTSH